MEKIRTNQKEKKQDSSRTNLKLVQKTMTQPHDPSREMCCWKKTEMGSWKWRTGTKRKRDFMLDGWVGGWGWGGGVFVCARLQLAFFETGIRHNITSVMCHQCIKAVDCHLLACTHHLLHPDLFSPKKLHDPPPPTTTTPAAKLATDNSNYLKHAFFWATAYAADLISTTQLVTLPLTIPSLCLCVCVSLSLSRSRARASERASFLARTERSVCVRERELPRYFCFSADRGSWLALLTGLVSQSTDSNELLAVLLYLHFYSLF